MTFNKNIPGTRDFLGYVYDLRWYLLIVVAVFVVFTTIGFAIAVTSPTFTDNTISGFKDQVGPLKETSALGLMMGIFENNVLKCFAVAVGGVLFGLAPLFFTVANGVVIGIVVGSTIGKSGLLYVLVGILPHGIIEMPMVFLSAAIGLKLGADAFRLAFRFIVAVVESFRGSEAQWPLLRNKLDNIGKDLKEGLLIFAFWVAPLLLIAAFMETFVTGTLLYLLFAH